MKLKLVLPLAALSVFGCASQPVTADWVSDQTRPSVDPFQNLTWTVGPYLPYHAAHGYKGRWYLCSATTASGATQYLLGVENISHLPEIFTNAASIAGEPLTAQQSGGMPPPYGTDERDGSVIYREKVRIFLSKDILKGAESSGLSLRLYGGQGDLDLVIPGAYIQGFLRKT